MRNVIRMLSERRVHPMTEAVTYRTEITRNRVPISNIQASGRYELNAVLLIDWI